MKQLWMLRPRLVPPDEGASFRLAELADAKGMSRADLEAVANLVANAARHAPPGTDVEVRVEKDAETVRIHAIDDSPGLPPGGPAEPHFVLEIPAAERGTSQPKEAPRS